MSYNKEYYEKKGIKFVRKTKRVGKKEG